MVNGSDSYIVLLIKGVHTIFCYYNTSAGDIDNIIRSYGTEGWTNSKPLLNLYYLEDGISRLKRTVELDPFADNWYIDINEDDKEVFVELCRRVPNGDIVVISKSNTVTTPRGSESNDKSIYFINLKNSKE